MMLMAACAGPSGDDGPGIAGAQAVTPSCHPQVLRLASVERGAQGLPQAALPPDLRESMRWRRAVLASCLSSAANVPRDLGPEAPRRPGAAE